MNDEDEAEAEARRLIVRALRPLTPDQRRRVLASVQRYT